MQSGNSADPSRSSCGFNAFARRREFQVLHSAFKSTKSSSYFRFSELPIVKEASSVMESICSGEVAPSSRWSSTTLSCGEHNTRDRIHISDAFYDGPYFDPLSPASLRSTAFHIRVPTKGAEPSPHRHPTDEALRPTLTHTLLTPIRRLVKVVGSVTQRFLRVKHEQPSERDHHTHGESSLISASGPWSRRRLISREIAMVREDIVRRPEGFEMRGTGDLFVYF